eukprot:15124001-Alexandrium_andersonii.AAC.1
MSDYLTADFERYDGFPCSCGSGSSGGGAQYFSDLNDFLWEAQDPCGDDDTDNSHNDFDAGTGAPPSP